MKEKFNIAIQRFDDANSGDPHMEIDNGKEIPKELLYAQRMTKKLNLFFPNASMELQLAVRCQHICRWEISRDSYEMNRQGYLEWRKALSLFHVEKASSILTEVGFDQEIIDKVSFLLQKKQLKRNEESQVLEDVICLVFLEHYFEKFSKKYSEEKLIDIIKKTWLKMSDRGHEWALKIDYSENSKNLIERAVT